MKKIIRKLTIIVLSILAISSFVACDDDSTLEGDPEVPQAPRMVSLGFSLSLVLHNELAALETVFHTYVKDGYTVVISDGFSPDKIHVDVNLEEILKVEVSGDIVVTIFHPSFQNNTIDTVAYFGIEELTVNIVEKFVNVIDLELVQGFVLVKAEEGLASEITSVQVLRQSAELDVVYYTNAPVIFVVVKTTSGDLRGRNKNILGEGVQYSVLALPKVNDLLFKKLLL